VKTRQYGLPYHNILTKSEACNRTCAWKASYSLISELTKYSFPNTASSRAAICAHEVFDTQGSQEICSGDRGGTATVVPRLATAPLFKFQALRGFQVMNHPSEAANCELLLPSVLQYSLLLVWAMFTVHSEYILTTRGRLNAAGLSREDGADNLTLDILPAGPDEIWGPNVLQHPLTKPCTIRDPAAQQEPLLRMCLYLRFVLPQFQNINPGLR
jgi:hypothetical protein